MVDFAPTPSVLAALDAATLAAAVAQARSWRQVLMHLGLPPNGHAKRLRERCDEWGIGYEHIGRHRCSDEQLREALASASSWAEATARLGYAEGSGSARATLHRHARRLGVQVDHLAAGDRAVAGGPTMDPDTVHLRDAGPLLVAAAFMLAGHRVSWPLEPAVYDLLVDTGPRVLRVQVKTTTRRAGLSWGCSIRRSEYADVAGGKRQALYSPEEIDAFGIVDGDGSVYVIPIEAVVGMSHLTLAGYEAHRVPRLPGP